jgi:hypothetical protein
MVCLYIPTASDKEGCCLEDPQQPGRGMVMI